MGQIGSLISDSLPPAPTFSVDQIPDLTGKIAIVTGSSAGIGMITVKHLLNHNATVYMANRSAEKTARAIQKLKEETGKEAIFLKLDLTDLNGVKKAAAEYMSKEKELHMLFNNAGVMMCPIKDVTLNDYDLQFGTNVIGHFCFTTQLLPILTSTARSTGRPVRVVNVSSAGHRLANTIDFETLKNTPKRVSAGTTYLYNQSKLGNILFSNELARRYADQGIVSTALHPGNLKTELQRHFGWVRELAMGWMFGDAEKGALTQLWAATMPETEGFNGKYLTAWARVGTPNPASQNPALAKKLWEWLDEQVSGI
ncbi:hypothetical protein HGRIS_013493 [Hohenbuehelia grisea]|uniref:NAD(P)-binding protein n=1 Tax=Hohenbuehelia grisea TaxID=104357 RepID=A0ABR3IVP2_9AGAR